METAGRYESDAYQAVKQFRLSASDTELILIDSGAVSAEDRMPNTKGRLRNS